MTHKLTAGPIILLIYSYISLTNFQVLCFNVSQSSLDFTCRNSSLLQQFLTKHLVYVLYFRLKWCIFMSFNEFLVSGLSGFYQEGSVSGVNFNVICSGCQSLIPGCTVGTEGGGDG